MNRQWGGSWTESKLDVFEKYLRAYLKIFQGNERARHLKTLYVDAFAGSGSIVLQGGAKRVIRLGVGIWKRRQSSSKRARD